MGLNLFVEDPGLLDRCYQVKSTANPDGFREFLQALGGTEIEINEKSISDLTALCTEFGFPKLQKRIGDFTKKHQGTGSVATGLSDLSSEKALPASFATGSIFSGFGKPKDESASIC